MKYGGKFTEYGFNKFEGIFKFEEQPKFGPILIVGKKGFNYLDLYCIGFWVMI